MNWPYFLGLFLVPFYVALVCWLARPVTRFVSRRWPQSPLLFSWRV